MIGFALLLWHHTNKMFYFFIRLVKLHVFHHFPFLFLFHQHGSHKILPVLADHSNLPLLLPRSCFSCLRAVFLFFLLLRCKGLFWDKSLASNQPLNCLWKKKGWKTHINTLLCTHILHAIPTPHKVRDHTYPTNLKQKEGLARPVCCSNTQVIMTACSVHLIHLISIRTSLMGRLKAPPQPLSHWFFFFLKTSIHVCAHKPLKLIWAKSTN